MGDVIDSFRKLGGGSGGASAGACDHVAGDLEPDTSSTSLPMGRPTIARLDERKLRLREEGGVERIKADD